MKTVSCLNQAGRKTTHVLPAGAGFLVQPLREPSACHSCPGPVGLHVRQLARASRIGVSQAHWFKPQLQTVAAARRLGGPQARPWFSHWREPQAGDCAVSSCSCLSQALSQLSVGKKCQSVVGCRSSVCWRWAGGGAAGGTAGRGRFCFCCCHAHTCIICLTHTLYMHYIYIYIIKDTANTSVFELLADTLLLNMF